MSKNVTILGAGGQIARLAVPMIAAQPDVNLTVVARSSGSLGDVPSSARVIAGDIADQAILTDAIRGADIVYANLSGPVDELARQVTATMAAESVDRLIFVTSLGIYDEVPGEFGKWNTSTIGPVLNTYRAAADVVTGSDLDFTNIRPAWLSNDDEIEYETTERDEPFRGTVVSRKSVAALVSAIVADPALHSRGDVGVNKPGTDGPTPQW